MSLTVARRFPILARAGFPPRIRLRRSAALLFIALMLSAAARLPAAAAATRDRQAEALARAALELLSHDTFDERRFAIQKLEDATLMAPGHADWELALARAYMRAGYLGLARHRFDKVRQFAPQDAEARFGLGQVWRTDWLKYLESESETQAIANFREAARLAPKRADASIMLVPLLVEHGEIDGAADAARAALAVEPGRLDAILADAYTAYRQGRVEHADSAFRRAVPRLPRALRDRFEDIHPVASERDTLVMRQLWPHQLAAFTRRFWRQQDPDLASPENEAQLEYWARITHAYLLYYDARRQAWDERGEMYVRFGAPAKQVYNGVNAIANGSLQPIVRMPMNVLVWEYPELGMTVTMQDRFLSGVYLPARAVGIVASEIIDPSPDPDTLRRHPELAGVGGGRGVFPKLPPGTKPLPVDGAIAMFEGANGPRLLGGFEAPGSPLDSLTATWVVRDSEDVEIARATRTLSPSACEPTEAQVADFASDLPPGRYSIGCTIAGSGRRRGTFRQRVEIPPPGSGLALSDLVISCGVPDAAAFDPREPAVRVEPNPSARVKTGDPLTAYFEISQLRPDADGLTRFEFNYTVRSLEKDARVWIQRLLAPRPLPNPIRTTRSEQQLGTIRRQFVSVPLQSMPPGRYRVEVRVRDLVSDEDAGVFADFTYGAPPPADGPAGPAPASR